MGKDECFELDIFQDFEDRSKSVCESEPTNPHMAGVYGTALYFFKEEHNWVEEWNLLENQPFSFNKALNANWNILPKDVLSNISLINFYNFVTVGRQLRAGDSDRIFVNEPLEKKLFADIINIIKPDTIIVQSKNLRNHFINHIKPKISNQTNVFIGYHPSVFGRFIKYRHPKMYIGDLTMNGKI